jgi:hypothetical protein
MVASVFSLTVQTVCTLYTNTLYEVKSTGRPLSKVLPCPNKGSRSCFVNVPLRRYISFNVHRPGTLHMYRQFSAYTQLLSGLQFSFRNLS